MSIFANPTEHAVNPPETWQVVKVADRNWHLRPASGDGTLDYFTTKRDAEAAKTDGWVVRQYEKERRWYAGEPVQGWRPYFRSSHDDEPSNWGLASDQTRGVVCASFRNPVRDLLPWWKSRGHTGIRLLHRATLDARWHLVGKSSCECADVKQPR